VGVDDLLAQGTGVPEQGFQLVALAPADGPLQRRQVLAEALQHLQHGLAVVQENIAPHDRVRGGDAGEVAEAAGGILGHLDAHRFLHIADGGDDRIGDQMRQVRGNAQYPVVMMRIHDLHHGAAAAPQLGHPRHRRFVGSRRRRQHAPTVLEQIGEPGFGTGMFGPGDRMTGHEVHTLGQIGADVADRRLLHRAHVGEDGPGAQGRGDGLGQGIVGAERRA